MAEFPTLRAVVFRVGQLACAAPAALVREILPPLPATRIPGVAAAVEGLVNVRGTLLTVADAHPLLQQERDTDGEAAIIVLDLDARRFGLLVSEVLDFLELPAASVAARHDLPGVDPRIVQAVGRWGAAGSERHFILLDFHALLAPMIGS